jgi:carboxypeptidase family protein
MKLLQFPNAFRGFIFAAVVVLLSCAVFAQSQSTSSIQGIAIDHNGAAIAGARVTAYCDCDECPKRPCRECCPSAFSRTVTTDDQGRFRMSDVPAGVYRVKGELTGFKAVEVHGVEVNEQGPATVTIKFEGGDKTEIASDEEKARLEVKIIDLETNRPLENAKVTLLLQCDCRKECPTKPCSECCPSEQQMFTSVTDASGVITFDGPAGTYRVDTGYRAFTKDAVVNLTANKVEKLRVTFVLKDNL